MDSINFDLLGFSKRCFSLVVFLRLIHISQYELLNWTIQFYVVRFIDFRHLSILKYVINFGRILINLEISRIFEFSVSGFGRVQVYNVVT